jgi:uncharacterized RDD family membrane protein YckC
LHEHLSIETPEQIPLEFPLAGIGSRFLALAVDTAIQVAAGLLLFLLALWAVGLQPTPGPASMWVWAGMIIVTFLLQFGYFAFFEAVWNGQTPGKRALDLRVIKDSGRPITVYDAVSRNLLRIVDSLPGIYAVGIASALFSSRNKRLGDYVAGTVVVHERPLARATPLDWSFAGTPAAQALPFDVGKLTPEEVQLIEAFLLRRNQLTADVRARMAAEILGRLAAKLGIPPEHRSSPERLLESLASDYRNRARYGG